jgi:hypothetical protein
MRLSFCSPDHERVEPNVALGRTGAMRAGAEGRQGVQGPGQTGDAPGALDLVLSGGREVVYLGINRSPSARRR